MEIGAKNERGNVERLKGRRAKTKEGWGSVALGEKLFGAQQLGGWASPGARGVNNMMVRYARPVIFWKMLGSVVIRRRGV